MSNPDIQILENLVKTLGEAFDAAQARLKKSSEEFDGPTNLFEWRDTQGRFLLADIYVTYSNASMALIRAKETERAKKRPCEWKNSNVCIAEGCFGESCLKV